MNLCKKDTNVQPSIVLGETVQKDNLKKIQ